MINPELFLSPFLILRNFIPADLLFIFAIVVCVLPSGFGFAWLLGYGREWRHRNWSSEQSLRGDKHYAEYFKSENKKKKMRIV